MAHERPVGAQLLLGLQEVAAIGPQRGAVCTDDGSACRAIKARDVCAAGVTVGRVLTLREGRQAAGL